MRALERAFSDPLPCLLVMWREGFFHRLNDLICKYFIIKVFFFFNI